MKKPVKWILIGLIIIAAAGYGYYTATLPLSVDTLTVSPVSAETYFTQQGYVKSREATQVYPLVSGEIISVSAARGDYVEAGDVLCVVDGTEYRHELAQVESSVAGYLAQMENLDLEERSAKDDLRYSLESLENDYNALLAQENTANISIDEQLRLQSIIVEQCERNLENAEDDLVKGKTLYNGGQISRSEYDALVQAVDAYASELDSQRQQLEVIRQGGSSGEYYESAKASLAAQIRGLENSLASSYTGAMKEYYQSLISGCQATIELLNKKLADCEIKAPLSGEVTELYVKNTNVVSASAPVAVIKGGEEALEIEVYVATSNIDAVNIGDEVVLTAARSLGDVEFTGAVTDIGDEAVIQLTALGVEERRVKVIVSPGAAEGLTLSSGYDVDVKFITYREDDKITVPKTAVFTDSSTGGDMVFIISDGVVQAVAVELGVELRSEYVVESGLSAGDVVVRDADNDGLSVGAKAVSN